MSFLSRLFGSKPAKPQRGDLDSRLERLESEADRASPGYVGTSYNRAGDLARKEGELTRAVTYYGRAIDAFLEDAQREAARGVANKIIRVRPDAVRTLCTLTWLDLSAGHSATALLHLRDYIEAVAGGGRRELAASQVYEMARTVTDSEFIAAAADSLDGLDFSDQATEVREWVATDGSPEAVRDPTELAQACLQAAVRSNERGSLGGSRTEDTSEEAEGSADAGAQETAPTSTSDAKVKKKYRWD